MDAQAHPRLLAPIRIVTFGALAVLVPLFLYFIAAIVGALIPANPSWRPPREGIRIFVQTNGVHTAVVVPAVAAGVDWLALLPPAQFQRAPEAGDHLAFAWGDSIFYLNTPTWDDLTPGTALRAVFGRAPALMHVHHLRHPSPSPTQRPVLLAPAQYRRLSRHILATFRLTAGAPAAVIPGYGANDMFYAARGSWTPFRTSNEWTGATLRQAGVRMGVWTPLSTSVMCRFDEWRLRQ